MTRVKNLVNQFRDAARRPDFLIELALLISAFLLYARTMPPTVLDGDSGEFQFMAYILGVPHSSGYPLYVLLTKLFTFLPINDVAFRVNLFSVICAAVAVPFIYAVAMRVIHSRIPSTLVAIIFAVTQTAWGAAIETKPYSFHFLLGVLALWFALRWHQEGKSFDFYGLALSCGLGLTNHHVFLFTGPAFAFVTWLNRVKLNRKTFLIGALLVVVPLFSYAYIPIRANQLIATQDPKNWELYTREDAILKGTITAYYINTPQGWLNLITGLDNSYKLGYTSDAERTNRFTSALNLLLQQFNLIALAIAALGVVESFRRDRKIFWILLIYGGGVGFISVYMRAAISSVYYFSLAYFIIALWIGFGIDALMKWSSRINRLAPYALASLILVLPITAFIDKFPRIDENNNYAPRDYAQAVMKDNIGQNAVVIAPWEVSQPIRYFQFVENQRADMLVTNISPLWTRQFDTMLKNARAQNRPFYWVQFDPELPTPSKYRWVQAVPLPMQNEPRPKYPLSNAQIVPQTQVLGYDLDPNPPQPGKPMRVLIYYNARERMYPMYSSQLTVTDVNGKLIGEYPGFPGTQYFPTYRWYEIGNYYRDTYSFVLPADAPAGLYNLDLSWSVYDLDSRTSNPETESKVSLGAIRVGDLSASSIANKQTAKLGDAISFLGWNGNLTVARGQSLNLDLFWQTDRALKDSYTVFVHLTDASGQVVADADSAPSQGLYPTNLWKVGEDMRDRHILNIPADLQPGTYSLEIGMYLASTNTRLAITSVAVTTDKIVIGSVNVR
jgi:hypothetical protein